MKIVSVRPHRRRHCTLAGIAALALAALATPVAAAPGELCFERATPPAELVERARLEGETFSPRPLLAVAAAGHAAERELAGTLAESTLVVVDTPARAALLAERPRTFALELPAVAGRSAILDLVRVDIFAADFTVVTSSSGGRAVPYQPGAHYRGVVRGAPESLAAVSVFEDEVMAIFRDARDGAVVLGRVAGRADGVHVLYPEWALGRRPSWSCATADGVPGKDDGGREQSLLAELADAAAKAAPTPTADAVLAKCVRIYIEVDYDIFQNKGSVTAATNYLTGVFNQSAVLYANDQMPVVLSQVLVWNTTSPYNGYNTSSSLLSRFQSYRNSFNGDLGHLVALRGNGGIAAGFNAFCNSNIDNRQCFSGIQSSYSNVPTYSWTVEVFTHEMGHLMGSRHTHACVWNGNNTQIDGCSTPEGSCPRVGYPSGGGTIMSYCHLVSGVGINFNNGFGTQPGNTIRSRFAAASCLNNCNGGGGCTGTTYTGSLSGTGAAQYQPNGTYYYSGSSGTHSGQLSGPGGTDFDLYLQKWNGSAWANVASGTGSTSTESVSYNGTAGYYIWRVYSYSGSGSYALCATRP